MGSEPQNIQFDADELIGKAMGHTGFSDFGSLPYRDGLEVLLKTYDLHVQDPAGRKRCLFISNADRNIGTIRQSPDNVH